MNEVKTKAKQDTKTQLCLMYGAMQCYMFRFQRNHHPAIRTKTLKRASSTSFCRKCL